MSNFLLENSCNFEVERLTVFSCKMYSDNSFLQLWKIILAYTFHNATMHRWSLCFKNCLHSHAKAEMSLFHSGAESAVGLDLNVWFGFKPNRSKMSCTFPSVTHQNDHDLLPVSFLCFSFSHCFHTENR